MSLQAITAWRQNSLSDRTQISTIALRISSTLELYLCTQYLLLYKSRILNKSLVFLYANLLISHVDHVYTVRILLFEKVETLL